MTRRPADPPDFPAPALHHEFRCASSSALVAAYVRVSEAPWIDSCEVDLPNLRLTLRVSAAAKRPSPSTQEWLQRIEEVSRGDSER